MPWAEDNVVGARQVDPLKSATWFVFGAAAQKVGVPHERYDVPWGEGAGTGGPRALTLLKNNR
jgi:hypothetical protein